ncbi:hypothetical protein CY34DRAFT_807185 [Suillus luteus UH-Slu-Lm8-n1]|uniref:Protein FAM72 n=1 Tax=Suillus luteus UH-Slu-Lm8-n1 TaxID=930992 RepID=A0A0D0B1T2_9AGAM|nr:hypothetical protein CY34DRAFT_807185 [Suillus luteus UH-Slu-Lm8-n1]
MPALAFADTSQSVDHAQSSGHATNRDPINYYMRPPAPRGQRSPNDLHALYDNSNTNFINPYSQPAYFERVYPLAGQQIAAQPQNTLPPPSMFSYFAVPPQGHAASWQTHLSMSMVQHNSYPPPTFPPAQLAHKVWILDCKSCGTFLTNRGMKAVLLLRPNVSLFSTDALPINCSAYTSNPDALRPPPCRPSTNTSPPRTCECLTQTLCCHTCGTAVGYMIVIPCSRCTSSITATNRATNGHRFVFHSSEILASERYHIPDEPGVIPVEFTAPISPPPLTSAYSALPSVDGPASYRRILHPFPSQPSPSPTLSHASSESIPTPISEDGDSGSTPHLSSPDSYLFATSASPRRSPRPLPRSPSPHASTSQPMQSSFQPGNRESAPESSGMPVESPVRRLKAGDVLYWHHLAKNGEIPGVQEDPRARVPKKINGPKFSGR